ncbi:MAG: Asp-tRNA(Asn)/Glu-tRNA(Gln) amidotransferase subunit GatC [Nitrospinota bacterium]|nr:MAG: Asp-tRNA(Asn)/Glu-tRNA(Gln) amidotransferase subunit GatC [Nitrospinota bacterium]
MIDREAVEHVATLARLALSEEEMEKFTHQLSDILTYVNKLNELDTSNVEPTSHVLTIQNVFREDQVRPSIPITEALANAPEAAHRYFKVPKIIEEA